MTEEKLAISDFNREELLDILSLLYVQGDRIIVLNNKMQNAIKTNRQLRLQQATKRKKNRIANIVGLVLAVASLTNSYRNLLSTLIYMIIMYLIGQGATRFFMLGYSLKKAEAEKVLEEATLEVTNTTQYQSDNQEKQELENDSTFSYFISLIPDNFCKLEDFAGMIVLLKDYRAMNFQEAANLWRTEQHQQQMLQQQKQLERQLHQNYDQVMAEVRESANRLRQDMQNARNESSKVNRNLEAIRRNGVGIKSRLI
ncbi:hypothetical protein [Streptococcus anginosus]|uniref:hypothetical protein n=1 Tax=Streptococcus anginosus TaxID=1328 RepID=UPI0021F89F42|nr:hypothetical protein [Streptococcus anginosus]MCW0971657.1 hypothetical protein [Streptococcus anginosus]MCW1029162.1 hypothetical protein [Streptococcus anginosus]MCW1039957.1 hypothetical protein [Streptococcus anginosus]